MKNRKSMFIMMVVVMIQLLLSANVFAANTKMTINITNNTNISATPSSANYAGILTPLPLAIPATKTQNYIETGIGNLTSFHIDYSSSTKKCHYDAASYTNIDAFGNSYCVYTKAAKSTGSAYATCTATVSALSQDPTNCAFTVDFGIR
jgi:hypothetical protein